MKKFIIRTYLFSLLAAGAALYNAQAHAVEAPVKLAGAELAADWKATKLNTARQFAAFFYKYYQEDGRKDKSYLYCLRGYDVESGDFVDSDYCNRDDKTGKYTFFTVKEMLNNPKDGSTPVIQITYNLLDGNTVKRTYQVALSDNGHGMFVIAPEDKLEVADLSLKSKDFSVAFKPVPEVDQTSELYIPMPVMKDGKVNMVEFGAE